MNKLPITKSAIFKLLKKISIEDIKHEKIELIIAKNRILPYDIKSKINLPPFNNSFTLNISRLKIEGSYESISRNSIP